MTQSANVLAFRNHVHPEDVTPAIRDRICRELSIDHMVWSGFLALMTLLVAAGLALIRPDNLSETYVWHLGTIIALALWAELICYFIYDRRKRFIRESRATAAIVTKERGVHEFDANVPSVQLRYLPRTDQPFDLHELEDRKKAVEVWAELDGLLAPFEKNLHVGDLVTILYDPDKPSHVRLVEFEH